MLEQAIDSVETIDLAAFTVSKLEVLRDIAAVYGKLGEPETAAMLLKRTLADAKTIDSIGEKSWALLTIISTSETLPKTHRFDLLQDIQRIALAVLDFNIDKDSDVHFPIPMSEGSSVAARDFDILAHLSTLHAREGNFGRALGTLKGISEREKVLALAQILTYRAENQNMRLIPGAVVMAATVLSPAADSVIEVEIFSLDRGCQRYADWWEVLDADTGELLYRHLISTPHVDQQPFTLTSAPLSVAPDQPLIIRAHMNVGVDETTDEWGRSIESNGYTTQGMQGTLERGFRPVRLSDRFAAWVEQQPPQPEACQPE